MKQRALEDGFPALIEVKLAKMLRIHGVCILMEELAPEMVLASPIHVDSGQVRCAHGILPVPATGVYFLFGVALSAVFQRYVPSDTFASLFGNQRGFGVLMAATIGVPLYACGGGTIPLLIQWLASGMSMGAASAFMITGSATKITNLGAVKIVLGAKRFILYLLFSMMFALVTGLIVNVFF